jgi:predicted nucleic acid-binding protein
LSNYVSQICGLSEEIIISAITVAELYAGVRDQERRQLAEFISLFDVIPVTHAIAESGGLYNQKIHIDFSVVFVIKIRTDDIEFPLLHNVVVKFV